MERKSLTSHERWIVISAMYTAAEQYRQNAVRSLGEPDPRGAQQYHAQRQEVRELAAIIEQAEGIELLFGARQ